MNAQGPFGTSDMVGNREHHWGVTEERDVIIKQLERIQLAVSAGDAY